MNFSWDPEKARRNLAKHGVSFELATRVWDDPLHVIVFDRIDGYEERWHAIGVVESVHLLVVVHTYLDDLEAPEAEPTVRIIGARAATKAERSRYEQETP